MIRPRALHDGARVALVAPAGPVTQARIAAAEAMCRSLALEPVTGAYVHGSRGFLSAADAERLADLVWAFTDPSIDGVWALRGGYGTMRLLPQIDFDALAQTRRPFIGFSDNTALHLGFDRADLITFHGPHAGGAFPSDTRSSFESVLRSQTPFAFRARQFTTLRGGSVVGRLIGGNLALLAATCGTSVQMRAANRIVVIEDVGEPLYRIDRMLAQLALAGALDGVRGLAFGQFSEMSDEDAKLLPGLLAEHAAARGVPAVYGLDFGHVDHNWTLPLGADARLDADAGMIEMLEPAVDGATIA